MNHSQIIHGQTRSKAPIFVNESFMNAGSLGSVIYSIYVTSFYFILLVPSPLPDGSPTSTLWSDSTALVSNLGGLTSRNPRPVHQFRVTSLVTPTYFIRFSSLDFYPDVYLSPLSVRSLVYMVGFSKSNPLR